MKKIIATGVGLAGLGAGLTLSLYLESEQYNKEHPPLEQTVRINEVQPPQHTSRDICQYLFTVDIDDLEKRAPNQEGLLEFFSEVAQGRWRGKTMNTAHGNEGIIYRVAEELNFPREHMTALVHTGLALRKKYAVQELLSSDKAFIKASEEYLSQ